MIQVAETRIAQAMAWLAMDGRLSTGSSNQDSPAIPEGGRNSKKMSQRWLTMCSVKKIRIRRGNKVHIVTKLEAAIEVFLNKAVAGDHHAFAKLIQVLDKLGGFNLPPKETIGSPGVVDYTEKLQRLIDGVIRSHKEDQMRAEESQSSAPRSK
jgi:hypothetical protein